MVKWKEYSLFVKLCLIGGFINFVVVVIAFFIGLVESFI